MPRLGELLVEAGALSEEQLRRALERQRQRGGRLGTNLVELGLLTENALARTLSTQLRLPAVSPVALERVPPDVLRLLPRDSAVHHRAVPVRLDGPHLWVAMSDPSDARAVAALDAVTRCLVRPMVAPDALIGQALARHYHVAENQRAADAGPPLDLRIETGPVSSRAASAVAAPPTPYDDPYTPAERAAIDARVLDLDERGAPAVVSPGLPRPSQGRLGGAALGARLLSSSSQRDVFEAALAFLAQDFQRMVVLVIRGGRFAGFLCAGRGVNESALPDFGAATSEIAVLAKVLSDGRPRLGRASPATLGSLARVLGPTGDRAVLVMPIRCADKPVGCIVAADGNEGVEAYIDEYVACGHKVDLALQMLVLRKRLMES